MSHLSDKQREIFDYIRSYIDEKGVSPSVREIGQAVGLRSTSTVQYHLTALKNAGYIERDPLLKRTLRLTGGAQSHAGRVPLLGTVTAGMPILAVEEIEDYIPYGGRTEGKTLFALHVRGDSMVNAAILDGDIIVVEQTPTARNGEIVVALVGDEATVKRFYKENGHFRLQPENDDYAPIIVDEVAILGKVVACLRYY